MQVSELDRGGKKRGRIGRKQDKRPLIGSSSLPDKGKIQGNNGAVVKQHKRTEKSQSLLIAIDDDAENNTKPHSSSGENRGGGIYAYCQARILVTVGGGKGTIHASGQSWRLGVVWYP